MKECTLVSIRKLLKRIYSDENNDCRNALCGTASTPDEKRIWELCQSFWPNKYANRTLDFDQYIPRSDLSDQAAKQKVNELTELLDKSGWK